MQRGLKQVALKTKITCLLSSNWFPLAADKCRNFATAYQNFSSVVYLSKTWETAQDIEHICITTPPSRLCEFAENILYKFTITLGAESRCVPMAFQKVSVT